MTPRLRTLAGLLALTIVAPAFPRAEQTGAKAPAHQFPTTPELADMLGFLVADKATPGIVLGILDEDGSTRVLSNGAAGAGARPLGPRTVFEIGSINKTFTGTLLADMAAKKDVALTDPISKYLPAGVTAPSRNGKQITLLDLATHRSGLPRLPDNHVPADWRNPYADYTVEKLYAFLSTHQLRRDPGAEAEYSNLGFGLLGHLLARAAGTSYQQLVKSRVLDPLGMTMTGYALDGAIAEWMAKGHNKGEVVPFWFATEAIEGAGGLRSNLDDMMKYLKAQVGPANTALQKAMRDAATERAALPGGAAIGLGWQLVKVGDRTLVAHGGGTGGFSTYIGFDPGKRVGFVMLTNTTSFPDDIGMDFLRRGPPLPITAVTVPPAVLKRYVGTYEAAPGNNLVIALEPDNTLTVKAGNNVRFRMFAESDSQFFLKRTPWRFTFTTDEAGTVTGVVVDVEGTIRNARKVS
ncbi:MAG TPA: serine hydrolase [Vicinamibacterales bacterium]|nr:serine hydrolase [Vicinamibacterales bacterium]